jgi:pimeloyl-ACP methyl ester carboxylesterase
MFPEAVECLAGDLSAQEKALVWATHCAPAVDLYEAEIKTAAWRTKPSWYIVANQDRTVAPDLQRVFAGRIAATIYEIESSHMVMLSHPEFVIEVIRQAAQALQDSRTTTGFAS